MEENIGSLAPWANLTAVGALIVFLGYLITRGIPQLVDRFGQLTEAQQRSFSEDIRLQRDAFREELKQQRNDFREDLKEHREQFAEMIQMERETMRMLADEIKQLQKEHASFVARETAKVQQHGR